MTTQGKTNWLLAGAVALLGYLLGSISWARIIAGRVKPEADISRIEEPVPNSEAVFVTDSVSATAVRVHVGTRYGCLTAVLDMLKVALPTLLLRRWQPDKPYHLISALAGAIGHDWPLYYRFKGGRGESVIYGALLVIEGWNPEVVHNYHLRNYIYFAMAFAVVMELINMRLRKTEKPVHLHNQPTLAEGERA